MRKRACLICALMVIVAVLASCAVVDLVTSVRSARTQEETPAQKTAKATSSSKKSASKTETTVAGAPTTGAATAEAPTAEAPTAEAPTAEAPTAEAPTAEAPTTEPATTEAPTTEPATTESWSVEEPGRDDSSAAETAGDGRFDAAYTSEYPFPAFSTVDMDGQTVTEDIFEEKPLTFINYWATWCGPCRNELPEFDAMVEKYGDKVSFVTIIDDGAGNADAAELVDRYLSGYTNLLPTASLVEPLQSGYVPTSIFVARGGNIVVFDGEYGGGYQLVGSYGDYSEFIDAALGIVGAQ